MIPTTRMCLSAMAIAVLFVCGCGAGQPLRAPLPGMEDPEMLNAAAAGRIAFRRGSPELAADQYMRALRRARIRDDQEAVADHAYNLAVALAAAERYVDSSAALTESEDASRALHRPEADLLLLRARLAFATGDDTTADAIATKVVTSPRSRPTASQTAAAFAVRVEVACNRRDIATATKHLQSAMAVLGGDSDAGGAIIARAAARIEVLAGRHAAAANWFDHEVRHRRLAARYPEMARALMDAAASYEQAGNYEAATDHYRRAAVSLQTQERVQAAKDAAAGALRAALRTGDPELLQCARRLSSDINRPAVPPSPATVPSN